MNVLTVDQLWSEQFPVSDVRVSGFKFAHVPNVCKFLRDEWAVGITFAVDQSEHAVAFFPPVLPCKPARSICQTQ